MDKLKPNEFPRVEELIPSSAGSRADLEADVIIGKVYGGYFSNPEIAKTFIDAGIMSIEKELPKDVLYADYGGGEGFLAKTIVEWLKLQGHNVDAFVIDSNQKFLKTAQENRLKTIQCNLETCDFKNADLITMRAVNHYNSANKQIEILKNALKSLKDRGVLISQISSGSEANCRLRSDIINLDSLGRTSEGENFHWTSVEEYIQFLKEAGFKDIEVVGYAPDCHWSPEEQWDRFREKETKEAEGSPNKIKEINERKKKFLEDSYSLIKEYINRFGKEILDIKFSDDGMVNITYKYPIIKSKK